jgi:hypothetical protein
VFGGDPRWGRSTALHGSIISNQPSITQFLVDHGAKLDAKNISGWTPLMMANGVFLANAKREYAAAAAILKKAMQEKGIPIEEPDMHGPDALGTAEVSRSKATAQPVKPEKPETLSNR